MRNYSPTGRNIVKQFQNAKNKNNALCINILQFKINPVCHYEPSRKAWRGNPVKNRRFFTNAASVVTTMFVSNLRLPEMITDKSVTTLISVDELLCNSLDCHAVISSRLAMTRFFNILKLFDYKFINYKSFQAAWNPFSKQKSTQKTVCFAFDININLNRFEKIKPRGLFPLTRLLPKIWSWRRGEFRK